MMLRHRVRGKEEKKEKTHKERVTPVSLSLPSFLFPSHLLLSFSLTFPLLFSLLTAVIVSFSLSKNIVFLPRCKGGRNFDTCVTFSSMRRLKESRGKSGVLMTAECAARVMWSAGICSTRIKLFTSKTHCLLPDRAAERWKDDGKA